MRATFLLTSLIVSVFLISCGPSSRKSSDMHLLQDELEQVREERDTLRVSAESMSRLYDEEQRRWIERTSELNSKLRKLQDVEREKRMLQARYDSLQARYKQLAHWASELSEGYGPGIWVYSDDHQRPLYGRKPREATVRGIIDELNDAHRRVDNPLLVLKGIDERTVKLGVSDARKLSSQMGSAGAQGYIQTAVYSLASLPEIDCVQFEFEEGDHARPGRYCN